MSRRDEGTAAAAFGLAPRTARVAAGFTVLVCSSCAAFTDGNRDVRVVKGDDAQKGGPVSQVELQQDVQRFTSDFMAHVGEAGERIYDDATPKLREIALRRVLIYTSNALDIGTAPFPELNLVDMLVFVSLSRHAFERHWQPAVFGEQGRSLADVLAEADRQLWSLSGKILSDDQKAQLRELIAAWQEANPDRHSVEGVRFAQFSSRAGAVSEERAARARGLFGQIQAATQSADQALLMAERGMFLAQRMPFLLRLHARLAVKNGLDDSLAHLRDAEQLMAKVPAMRPIVHDLVAVSGNAASAAHETRLLLEAGEPYLERIAPQRDALEKPSGEPEQRDEKLSLGEALAHLDRISEHSLSLVRELRAGVPEDPAQVVDDVERRVDALARRIALYALIVGLGWAASFWGGYYLVKIRRR